jgi:hypothetical protein
MSVDEFVGIVETAEPQNPAEMSEVQDNFFDDWVTVSEPRHVEEDQPRDFRGTDNHDGRYL